MQVRSGGSDQLQARGQIRLTRFPNPAGLRAEGANMFRETASSGAPTEQTPGDAGAGSAVSTVTSAQDLAGATKTIQTIDAPSVSTVTVRAVTQRLEASNFYDRFNSEGFAAWLRLAETAHARLAEEKCLQDIKSGSVLHTDTPATYGAWRDLKRQLVSVVAELRDRTRRAVAVGGRNFDRAPNRAAAFRRGPRREERGLTRRRDLRCRSQCSKRASLGFRDAMERVGRPVSYNALLTALAGAC